MKKDLKLITLAFAAAIAISNAGICAETVGKSPATAVKVNMTETKSVVQYESADPLKMVENPQNYLNKKIKMTALFDKFSTIGLDYPPVNRSSKDYISFIIKRPEMENTGHTIPLSELKLIIKRDKAEKLIDLESGNKIEIRGTVFSTALGDPWVDVDEVIVLEPKPASPKKSDKKV